jgi:transposase
VEEATGFPGAFSGSIKNKSILHGRGWQLLRPWLSPLAHPVGKSRRLDPSQRRKQADRHRAALKFRHQHLPPFPRHSHPPTLVLLDHPIRICCRFGHTRRIVRQQSCHN